MEDRPHAGFFFASIFRVKARRSKTSPTGKCFETLVLPAKNSCLFIGSLELDYGNHTHCSYVHELQLCYTGIILNIINFTNISHTPKTLQRIALLAGMN